MIGILGGTFDPIHLGHLRTARDILEHLGLEQVRFIPCGIPPHRPHPRATAAQRLAMVRAAIATEPGFVADDREIRREGPSYMIDTLASLRAELGQTQSMGLILGLDAFQSLEAWHRWQELIELAHLIVMTRPGYSDKDITSPALQKLLQEHRTADREDCNKFVAGRVIFCNVVELDISSTLIREKIKAKQDVSTLLPDSVLELIEQQHIYA